MKNIIPDIVCLTEIMDKSFDNLKSFQSLIKRFPKDEDKIKIGIETFEILLELQKELKDDNSNKENKTYQAGSHKLKGNPNAEKCYFVDNAPIENNQYGTQTPIRKNTQENGIVSISMYGKFTYRIKDAVKFSEIYTDDDVYLTTLRTYLINHYTTHAAQINYNDIILETKMSQDILNAVNQDIEKYGLEITEAVIEGFEVKNNTGEIIFKK